MIYNNEETLLERICGVVGITVVFILIALI